MTPLQAIHQHLQNHNTNAHLNQDHTTIIISLDFLGLQTATIYLDNQNNITYNYAGTPHTITNLNHPNSLTHLTNYLHNLNLCTKNPK